jgi:superfamily II DNA/RNA helicase
VTIEVARQNAAADTVKQVVHFVKSENKRAAIVAILQNRVKAGHTKQCIIFTNSRLGCAKLARALERDGIKAGAIHGDKSQGERTLTLDAFKSGAIEVLVATDVAARGLDIPEMKHVIHYHLPSKEDEFTHRNGRTARMLASGTAYIIAHESEKKMDYIDYGMEILKVENSTSLPKPSEFQTIYISGGKKNKLNKIDIVGFFSQKGKLEKGDLGLIEVKDFISFAAVKFNKVKDLLQNIRDEKMKGKKYKIEVARKVVKKVEE